MIFPTQLNEPTNLAIFYKHSTEVICLNAILYIAKHLVLKYISIDAEILFFINSHIIRFIISS